jgi:tetratricopeptide (TPR) repeat protein
MDCAHIAGNRVLCGSGFWREATRIATHIALFILVVIACLTALARTASAEGRGAHAAAVLEQARQYKLQYRTGDASVVAPWVALLEEATRTEPDNADLWYALGYVYLAQGAQALQAQNPAGAMSSMQKGPAALRQALKINPEHAPALSQLGGIQTLLGPVLKLPAMAPRGVGQMNRAVELAPESVVVRLMRAFAGPNLPPELRDTRHEAEDLDYLISVAEWGTAGDYLRILRGDLHYEMGQPEQARAMYRSVENTGSGASADASKRLAALRSGGVAAEDIKFLRSSAGAQCAMCHAR